MKMYNIDRCNASRMTDQELDDVLQKLLHCLHGVVKSQYVAGRPANIMRE